MMKPLILGASLALAGAAHAGHEFPFYPSFYPQEITVEALSPHAAAEQLAKGTLHAYAGAEITAPADAAKIGSVRSLGSYVVVNFDRRDPSLADTAARCARARSVREAVGDKYVWHPYPVTPYHADYLHHADRAEAALGAALASNPTSPQPTGRIEWVDVAELAARAGARYNGWIGPPWIGQGWFHAYLLLASAVRDSATREQIDDAVRRLQRGDHRGLEQRIDLERRLVALLQGGCERVVLGYTERRESYGTDYSNGVENVGYGAIEGLASAIFPRTAKLRDFPWNGWLNVAVPAAPNSAWNPVSGGFGDTFGRLVWGALADPASLTSPHGSGWIENRVNAAPSARAAAAPAVPEDALLPEPGTGRLAPVGRGNTAATRILYRVRNSAFHDGTAMAAGDLLYAYSFAAAWGGGDQADPGVAQATALARARLKGVRPLRVETETLGFGDHTLQYQVPVIEVYLDAAGPGAATVAPPWSTLPWHLLAVLEEGVRRGYFAFSAAGAAQRGVPELDPVRNIAQVHQIAEIAREFEERAHVPPSLARHASADEARARYRRLREFHAAHSHWLVTNGPYRLERWDGVKATLSVFRDPSYPKGLGSFNAHAVPLKGMATRVEPRADGAEVHTETAWLERQGREVRIVRGSFANRPPERHTHAGEALPLECRFLLISPDGTVASAGTVRAGVTGMCRLTFGRAGRPLGPGSYRLAVAPIVEGTVVGAPVRIVPWER